MEDVYTIKIKTKPDTRNLYPSERRYSASTVSGLAWVHIALAATSLLLACLALVNPTTEPSTTFNETENDLNATEYEFENISSTDLKDNDSTYILILAPTLIAVFGLAAGAASIMASVRWYIDHNITWLFIISLISTVVSLVSFIMVAVWFITTSEGDISEFYKDKVPFEDYLVVKNSDVVDKNESHILVALNTSTNEPDTSHLFTKRVLSINILIAAFLELLWSILSVKISYKGMKNTYREDDNERRGNCVSVVTTIKGNNTKKLPRNVKLLASKPDLIEHYPNKKIKRIFLAQNDNGFYLKNQNNKAKQNTETSSEFYKERMMSFLNRCASLEGISNPEQTPSVQSETLNTIPEVTLTKVEINQDNPTNSNDNMTTLSWGDTPDHTIYNQNTLNLEKIFKFVKKQDGEKKIESEISENLKA